MHIHLIGVCGTGMGALAALLKEQGHRVTGSDRAFYPPMGPALERWGVETMPGWDPANLEPAPELVVVGNVCRPDNPEARAALDGGLRCMSFPQVMEELFLQERRSFVIAGTHGKTTTSTLLSFLLDETHLEPGFLLGGVPRDFEQASRLGGEGAPFVIEGDEYDSAFFEKSPKFWRYRPFAVALTSIEHDHIDIYPDEASYLAAFEGLIERIPEDGILVAWAGCPRVRALAKKAKCRVRYYGLEDDDWGDVVPVWMGSMAPMSAGGTPIDLYGGGTFMGRLQSPLTGRHNARNALAALALATEGAGADLASAMNALARFGGVRRRQELLGEVDGIFVYEDFAHHPTAVRETIGGLQSKHGRVLVAFEPRSATASRKLHQEQYPGAFAQAALSVLAPVGRPEIAAEERLDTEAIAEAIRAGGNDALAAKELSEVVPALVDAAKAGDAIVLMSNGTFGGIYDSVLVALTKKALAAAR